jgi:hypothetical protein
LREAHHRFNHSNCSLQLSNRVKCCQMLSNAVKICKLLKILYLMLDTIF